MSIHKSIDSSQPAERVDWNELEQLVIEGSVQNGVCRMKCKDEVKMFWSVLSSLGLEYVRVYDDRREGYGIHRGW